MATIRQKRSTYAITIVTYERRPHFQNPATADLFITTLVRYRDAGKFALHAFAVMPNHVHVLITPAIDQSTTRCIQLLKGGFSFAARARKLGEIWSTGHHEHRIRDEIDFAAQKQYIANNPSRKKLDNYPHVHTHAKHAKHVDAWQLENTAGVTTHDPHQDGSRGLSFDLCGKAITRSNPSHDDLITGRRNGSQIPTSSSVYSIRQ